MWDDFHKVIFKENEIRILPTRGDGSYQNQVSTLIFHGNSRFAATKNCYDPAQIINERKCFVNAKQRCAGVNSTAILICKAWIRERVHKNGGCDVRDL